MNLESLQEEVNEINADGGDALALKLDVPSPKNWQDVLAQTQVSVKPQGEV